MEFLDLLAEYLTHLLGVLHKFLVLDHLQGLDSHASGERESTESRSVLTGLDVEHDVVIGKASRDRQHTTTQSLAQDDDVGTDAVVLAAQHLACTGDTGLHLVGDEQHVVLVAQVVAFLQIAIIGHKHASLALDGLDDEGCYLLAIFLESVLKGLGVIVGDADEAWGERAVVGIRAGVVAHGDDGDGASVEVALAADDLHLFVVNTFLDRTPTTCQLQRGLNGLGTRVHGQHLVIAKVLVDELLVLAECVVVECARGQAQHVGLILERLDDARMAVPLVDCRVGREEVKVFLTLDIPHIDALATMQHHGQRMIVVSAIAVLKRHESLALGLSSLYCLSFWFSLLSCCHNFL